MKEEFKLKDFDKVLFINNGNEPKIVLEAKEYLKDIQMTVNIGDVSESLFMIEDIQNITSEEETRVFNSMEESIFSSHSLGFLEKVKLLTSFEGINANLLKEATFDAQDNFIYLNQNLKNHCEEFITAIWDCILLLKMAHSRNETSLLVQSFNTFFSKLTKQKTGNANAYIYKETNLSMIVELVLFLQYYVPDFFIYLIKSEANIDSMKNLDKTNKLFVKALKKSKKIAHRLSMLEQIKSNNYQLLLKLLVEQKNSEL